MDPDRALGAGLQHVGSEDPHPHGVLAGTQVEDVGAPPRHRMVEAVEDLQGGVDHRGVVPLVRLDQHVAPGHLVVGDADQVHRAAAAGGQPVVVGVVVLQRPDPHSGSRRVDGQLVVHGQASAGERPGDHRAGALRREGPVDPQAGSTVVDGGRGGGQQLVEGLPELVEAHSGRSVGGHDGGVGQERVGDALLHLEEGQFDEVVVGGTDLGQGHHPVADPQ